MRFGQKGVPDLMCCLNGRSISVECKAGHDRMSEDQEIWRQKYEKAGGIYIIAHDVGDVIAVFNKLLEA